MKKEIWFIIIAVAIVLLGSLALLLNSGSEDRADPEKQKYAEFTANVACQMFEVTSLEELSLIVKNLEETTREYGYTETEIKELQQKYKEDREFAEITIDELEKECPDKVDQFDLDSYLNSLE